MAQSHTAGHLGPALPGHQGDLHQAALVPVPRGSCGAHTACTRKVVGAQLPRVTIK